VIFLIQISHILLNISSILNFALIVNGITLNFYFLKFIGRKQIHNRCSYIDLVYFELAIVTLLF
jgi:hypothetical protein